MPPNAIITTVAAVNNESFGSEILLVASGGTCPQIPAAIARSPTLRLIVDFWDDANPSLAAETRERLKTYRSLGYAILGASPDHGPEGTAGTAGRRGSAGCQPNTSRRQNRRHRR